MTTNHTPTPWYVTAQSKVEGITGEGLARSVAYRPREGVTYVLAEWCDPKDAAHIVRCVNSHDALVEALQEMIGIVEVEIDEEIDARTYRLEAARAALRAATGE